MKVLITGSQGFVGRELCRQLNERKVEIAEFDKTLGHDLLNAEQLNEACKGIDFAIHLAALLDESAGLEELRKVNVEGTKNLMDACVKQKVKKVLFLSTTGVYGDFKGQASEETALNPSTNYEQSKKEAEEIILSYQELMPAVIARSALVLGPNNYWKEIVKAIKKGFPIIGNGKNKWQIAYYKDLANSLVFLLYNPDAENEILNIAEEAEQAKDLNELVELFKKELGTTKKTKHIPIFLGYLIAFISSFAAKLKGKKTILHSEYIKRLLKNRNYSIKKIKALGWKPRYSTEQAVKETMQEINSALNSN